MCVDFTGKQCNGCLATNKVCYAQSKSWCDQWASYTWCGSEGFTSGTQSCGFGLGIDFNGIDFDLEAGLWEWGYQVGGMPADKWNDTNIAKVVNNIKKDSDLKSTKFRLTVNGNIACTGNDAKCQYTKNNKITQAAAKDALAGNLFDEVAIMLYGANMGLCSGGSDNNAPRGDWGLPVDLWKSDSAIQKTVQDFKNGNITQNTLGYLYDWYKLSKPSQRQKILLGVTPVGLAKGMINLYSALCKECGFGGIVKWRFNEKSTGPSGGGGGPAGGPSYCTTGQWKNGKTTALRDANGKCIPCPKSGNCKSLGGDTCQTPANISDSCATSDENFRSLQSNVSVDSRYSLSFV